MSIPLPNFFRKFSSVSCLVLVRRVYGIGGLRFAFRSNFSLVFCIMCAISLQHLYYSTIPKICQDFILKMEKIFAASTTFSTACFVYTCGSLDYDANQCIYRRRLFRPSFQSPPISPDLLTPWVFVSSGPLPWNNYSIP